MQFSNLDTGSLLLVAVIALAVFCIILYYIIFNAVRNANKTSEYYGRAQMRLEIKKMLKDGFARHDIVEITDDKENDFWSKIP